MTVRVGIVGWGEIARQHARCLVEAGATLAGVVSRRSHLVIGMPVYRSLGAMLPHVDAITVAVPNHLHAATCLQAISADVSVMVEKPLLITHGELEELEPALKGAGVPVHLGYRLRHNQALLQLRGRLSDVRRIRCIYRLGIEELAENKPWTYKLASTGGSFFTLGVHALDLARWLAGCRGEPLSRLRARADSHGDRADYPLRAILEGVLPNGIEIEAGADLRADSPSCIDLRVEAPRMRYPDETWSPPTPEDEPDEYEGLIREFVRAVETGSLDAAETMEVLQTHRELLAARDYSALVGTTD